MRPFYHFLILQFSRILSNINMKTRVFGLAKEEPQEHKIIMLTTFMTVQPGKTNVVRSSVRKDVSYLFRLF